MNANRVSGLKAVACGVVAAAVTGLSSWTFVASTAFVREAVAPLELVVHAVAPSLTKATFVVARAAATGLVK